MYGNHARIAQAGWEVCQHGCEKCEDWQHAVTSAQGLGVHSSSFVQDLIKCWEELLCDLTGITGYCEDGTFPQTPLWTRIPIAYWPLLSWPAFSVTRTWKDRWPARSSVADSKNLRSNITRVRITRVDAVCKRIFLEAYAHCQTTDSWMTGRQPGSIKYCCYWCRWLRLCFPKEGATGWQWCRTNFSGSGAWTVSWVESYFWSHFHPQGLLGSVELSDGERWCSAASLGVSC